MSILLENVTDELYEFLERYELEEKFQANCDVENENNSIEDDSLSDDIDIDALLAEVAEGGELNTSDLDIGDDILIDEQVNELTTEDSTDYTDSDVMADLLADENSPESESINESSEIDAIEELDSVDFDELLANIEEESHPPLSNELDLSEGFDENEIDLDAALDIGDELDADNNLDVNLDSDEDDFVSVDSLLSDSLDSSTEEEPYDKTDFDVGLNEFPEFAGDNSAEEDDDNGIAAKLDLAKVYIEIGDTENAEVILQDVVEKGDAQQQFDAQQLLDNIN